MNPPILKDPQYSHRKYLLSEIEHKYGSQIHILSDHYLFTTLAKLCRPDSKQPLINQLLNILYRELVKVVVNHEFPLESSLLETRMAGLHSEGRFEASVVAPSTKVVCVNLARAGTVPSQICFDAFNYILNPDGVRQDHISINRKVDADEKVVGTNLGGLKIGGGIEDSFGPKELISTQESDVTIEPVSYSLCDAEEFAKNAHSIIAAKNSAIYSLTMLQFTAERLAFAVALASLVF